MSNTLLNFRQLRISRKLIVSSLFIGLVGGLIPSVNAQPTTQLAQVGAFQNQANKAREAEGRSYTGAMARAQQAYFLEQNKFATTIEQLGELGLGIQPDTANYRLRILPQGNGTQRVMMTATAKRPGIRSYTSAVFVVKVKGENMTFAGVCGTAQPSSTPPKMPAAPKNASTRIQCPTGSVPL